MLVITEKEWKNIQESRKGITPLTHRRRYLYDNPANPHVEEIWITEGINFTILDKEGSRYADKTNN